MRHLINFTAQCPNCKNEVTQGPRDPDEIERLIREDCLSFYCELCDLEWEPSFQELANVELLLATRYGNRTAPSKVEKRVFDPKRIRAGIR